MFTTKTWSKCSGFYGKHPGCFLSRPHLAEREHGRHRGRELCLRPLDDVKECQRLFTVDRAMGRKCRCRRSAGDVVCIGPSDGSVVILAARYAIKVVASCILSRVAYSSPQKCQRMNSGTKRIGRKGSSTFRWQCADLRFRKRLGSISINVVEAFALTFPSELPVDFGIS